MRAAQSRLSGRLLSTTSLTRNKAVAAAQTLPESDWNHFISRETKKAQTDAAAPVFTLAVKDNIATVGHGLPTTCGSAMLEGYQSPFEATIVTQLRDRGGLVVGKTNLDEFGMGSHSLFSHSGPVQSPKAGESVSVGGSSGGSAVAVRLGDADVALGTDTGGSVRLPAAYGGVVGFKPSYGMLSRFGVVPYANSLDTVGLLAREVEPIRRLIVGRPNSERSEDKGLWSLSDSSRDPTSLTMTTRLRIAGQRSGYYGGESGKTDLSGLTIGIPLEYNIKELDPRIRTAWIAAAERLRALGAKLAAVSLPSTRHALSAYYVLAPAEAASNLARYDGVRYGGLRRSEDGVANNEGDGVSTSGDEAVLYERVRGAGLGPEVQQRILLGAYALSSDARDNYFVQAQRVRRIIVRDFDAVFLLANPLRDHGSLEGAYDNPDAGVHDHIDLSDLPEDVPLLDKRGPARVDFLLCPTAPTPAPKLADVAAAPSHVDAYINDVFTVPASMAGLPAISIPMPPVGAGEAFCPGFQLIGQFWDDARLLAVAETVMTASFSRTADIEALAQHRLTGVV
ncbi:Trimeric GatFAB AmidoTransferase(AdT) complex subunit [Sporothrix epigloea]|uniref:Glutamyl-tRNA(Gln) amidotransferase subunit A, mitochondrial n=1 Tax=Sporothrix epigloea TaxID=1892477 RepID=A0ABP0E1V6_9PEZI